MLFIINIMVNIVILCIFFNVKFLRMHQDNKILAVLINTYVAKSCNI